MAANVPAVLLGAASVLMVGVLFRLALRRAISQAIPVSLIALHILLGALIWVARSTDVAGRPNVFMIPPSANGQDTSKEYAHVAVTTHGNPATSTLAALELPGTLPNLPDMRALEFKGSSPDSTLWTMVPRDPAAAPFFMALSESCVQVDSIRGQCVAGAFPDSDLDHVALDAPIHLNGIEFVDRACWLLLYDGRMAEVPLSGIVDSLGARPWLVRFNSVIELNALRFDGRPPLTRGWQGLSSIPHDRCNAFLHSIGKPEYKALRANDLIFLTTNAFAHIVVVFSVTAKMTSTGRALGPVHIIAVIDIPHPRGRLAWDEGCCFVDSTWNGRVGLVTTEARSGTLSIDQGAGPVDSVRAEGSYIEGCIQRGHTLYAIDRLGAVHMWGPSAPPRRKGTVDLARFCDHAQDLAVDSNGALWIAWETSFRMIPDYHFRALFRIARRVRENDVLILALLLCVEAALAFRESGRSPHRRSSRQAAAARGAEV